MFEPCGAGLQRGVRHRPVWCTIFRIFRILSCIRDSQWIRGFRSGFCSGFLLYSWILCLLFLVSAVLSILLDFCMNQSCVKLDSAVLKLYNNACKGSCNVIVCFVPD